MDSSQSRVAEIARRLEKEQIELASMESEVKAKKEQIRELSEKILPEAMGEAEMTKFETDDGLQVTVSTQYFPGIPKETEHEAFEWLRDNGHDSIIKGKLQAEFGRGQDNVSAALLGELMERFPDNKITLSRSVHPQTLQKFVRERMEEGETLPESIRVFTLDVAKIKRAS